MSEEQELSDMNVKESEDESRERLVKFIERNQGGRVSAMSDKDRTSLEEFMVHNCKAGVSVEFIAVGKDDHGVPEEEVVLSTPFGVVHGSPDLRVLFRGSLPGCWTIGSPVIGHLMFDQT